MLRYSTGLSRGMRLGYGIESRAVVVRFPTGTRDLIFSKAFRPPLSLTEPLIQWIPKTLSPGRKRPRRESDHLLPPSAEIKNAWSYLSYDFMACTVTWPSLVWDRTITKCSRCTRNLIDSVQRSPSWQPDSHSYVHKIDRWFVEPKGLLPCSQHPNIQPNITQLNPISNLPPRILKTTLKLGIYLHQRLGFRSQLYIFKFLKKNFVRVSHFKSTKQIWDHIITSQERTAYNLYLYGY